MIGKVKVNQSFGAVCRYVLQEQAPGKGAEVLAAHGVPVVLLADAHARRFADRCAVWLECPVDSEAAFDSYAAAMSAVAVLAAGVLGAVRARRWAARRAGRSAWGTGLRLLPLLVPLAVFAAYPDLVSLLSNGRTITWAQLTYFPLPLTITLLVAALAGVSTALFRVVNLRRAGRDRALGVAR